MATINPFNGKNFSIPNIGDENWGGTLGVDGLLRELVANVLSRAGGLYTLSADVDWGNLAGHIANYYKSRSASISSTGILRLARTDAVAWRNAANSADLPLTVDGSNQLTYNGNVVLVGIAGALAPTQGGTGQTTYATGDTLYASALNTLSKLAIGTTGQILIVAGGVPTWGQVANAGVATNADIAIGKLAGSNANRILATNAGSNRVGEVAAIAAAHVLYADANGLPVGEATLAVTRGGLNLSSVAVGELPYGSGANTYAKLAAGTSGQFLQSGGAGAPNWRTGYILGSVQTFSASGTWTRPSGCRAIMVELVGGGGGSGGCAASAAGQFGEAGGGGGGGYSRKWIASPGSSETVTIGAGGTAASAGANNGGTGGTTSFGAHCQATGGTGGSGITPAAGTVRGAPGVGGVGSLGDINISGGDGGQGTNAGGVRISTGYGGSSFFAGQRRQTFASGGQNAGSAGYTYGGGASGSSQDASQSAIGGSAGGAGFCIVYEYY